MTEGEPPEENLTNQTEEVGDAAVGDTVKQIPVTADEAIAYNEERAANQAGWEATADQFNSPKHNYRSTMDKIRGKNKLTAEDVMHDEALRVNAEVDKKLADDLENAEFKNQHGLVLEKGLATTHQQAFKDLRRDELGEITSGGYVRLAGKHHGQEYHREPIFNPKAEYTQSSASEISTREKDTKPASYAVIKALEQNDIDAAEQALASSRAEMFHSHDPITLKEHITPKVREFFAEAIKNGATQMVKELTRAENLSEVLYPHMAEDGGASKEELKAKWMQEAMAEEAVFAIKQLGVDSPPNAKNFERRIETLLRTGIATREDLASDETVRRVAAEVTLQSMAREGLRTGWLKLPNESWSLLKEGFIDLKDLAEHPMALRIALGARKVVSKQEAKKAKQSLEEAFGLNEPAEAEQAAA